MEQITLHLTGRAPLLMHAPRTVNQLDSLTQEIKTYTGKRKKTEDDHRIIERLEFQAGLYNEPHNESIFPYIPGVNVQICLRDAGKLTKQGTAVTRGVYITEDLPIMFPGRNGKPITSQALWDMNFKYTARVGNQRNSVMRCRPMFPNWELTVPVMFEPSILDRRDLVELANRAGVMIGLGDYRPRFGRFVVEVVEVEG